jgi:hypothetical protein
MQVIIDRFEGDFAVCEKTDRAMINILRSKLPPGAEENDVLIVEGDNIRIDSEETARRKREADNMLRDVWKG